MSVMIVIDGRIKVIVSLVLKFRVRVIEKRYNNSGLKIFSSPTAHYDLSLNPTCELHHSDHQQSTHPKNDITLISTVSAKKLNCWLQIKLRRLKEGIKHLMLSAEMPLVLY